MRFFRQIIRGAGNLPGYGPHPGNDMVLIMMLMCGLAGAQKGGWAGFLGGAVIGAMFILPLWIYGCVSRANECDKTQARLLKTIKDS